jgi:hypothetical protein
MNERIRELAEQAHCYACEYAQRPDYNPHNPYNQLMYKQRYDSKFAELIVRECTQSIENTIETDCITDSEKMGCEFAITDLLKHFGVEE